jgi:hypothetical protein
LVEAGFWLGLCLFLYVYSYKNIEIYKFGASGWPRAIILLMAIAAIGQLIHHYVKGDETSSQIISAAVDDGSEEAAHAAHHETVKWYLSTFALLAIPFIYMRVPEWIAGTSEPGDAGLHTARLIVAAILIAVVVYFIRHHRVRVMLMLPLFFAALLEDFGFYALAPFFIIGVMYLFGERRPRPMVLIMALIFGFMLTMFVKILYVGLPVGNIEPFYSIGSWVVTVLQ